MYARHVAGRELDFLVSGMLWRNALVMQDRQTGSWWSQVTGEAIRGPLEGRSLEVVPSVQTSWADWVEAHPDTVVLAKDRPVGSSRYREYVDDPERTGLFRSRWLVERMPGKAMVLGLAGDGDAVAVPEARLWREGLVGVELAGRRVVLVVGSDRGVRAFAATPARVVADGDLLRAGEREWDRTTGRAVGGGVPDLEEVPLTRAFWFAWSSFHPNTRVAPGDGAEGEGP